MGNIYSGREVDRWNADSNLKEQKPSASFLAIKAKKYREAERMAAFGLIGNPPVEIAAELREAFNESLTHLKLVA